MSILNFILKMKKKGRRYREEIHRLKKLKKIYESIVIYDPYLDLIQTKKL